MDSLQTVLGVLPDHGVCRTATRRPAEEDVAPNEAGADGPSQTGALAAPSERIRRLLEHAFPGCRIFVYPEVAASLDRATLVAEVRPVHPAVRWCSALAGKAFPWSRPGAEPMLTAFIDIHQGPREPGQRS
jgi:hypothetical protein